ncbi:MAG: M56 family metallopeptidase, partial [Clostridiales bacterium]|nr:M56 family metallopeptidase [Clostridiales bacterium]
SMLMNIWREVFQAILKMTVVGGVVTAALLGLKPLISNWISQTAQYRLWLVALAAFLIPVPVLVAFPSSSSNSEYAASLPESQQTDEPDAKPKVFTLDFFVTRLSFIGMVLAFFFYVKLSWWHLVTWPKRFKLIVKCRRISLFVNEEDKDPVRAGSYGTFWPSVVLHSGGAALTAFQREFILRHELAHLRRKDFLVHQLAFVARYIHWFNPLAKLMLTEMSKICEQSCDESVVSDLRKSGREFNIECLKPELADPATLKDTFVALCEENRSRKEWLRAIALDKKHACKVIFIALALAAAAVLASSLLDMLGGMLQTFLNI